ncbi:MAG: DUF2478 domain-containing protein [Candidatus Bipolaricaulota bacterium]|nr:DUF2478 domain-containing protein [Candidatus Bipolaricaulota bacterium]MDW8151681.1 nucleoside-triphosphatase [Candidatus Bipolaricaulota bacterium]
MNPELLWQAQRAGKRALLLHGPRGSGKTSAVLALSAALSARGAAFDGVASPRLLRDGQTVGYWVRHLRTGEERLLCSTEPPGLPYGRFFFRPEALAFANAVLARAAKEAAIVVVDEVGPLELQGGGFLPGLQACLSSQAFLVLTVRPALVAAVAAWFGEGALLVPVAGAPLPPP